ncbi:MAG: hypothetical protein O7E52_07580 [Candidatus Poribacteria bacterium]|nr:hypothetical protein [Candidatus Poribacteria bacterium]
MPIKDLATLYRQSDLAVTMMLRTFAQFFAMQRLNQKQATYQ